MKIIILAGGSGTRLWPISRERYPKQFVKLFGEKYSLFQETFLRSLLLGSTDDVYVVTNLQYQHLVIGEVEELGLDFKTQNIIVEPYAKNTLPAILAGVLESTKDQNDTIVVFPSDHKITKSREFIQIIKNTKKQSDESIVAFGIKPNSPNTGYGYIQPGEPFFDGYKVSRFREKPNLETAEEYIRLGYYWNAGIFMFNSRILLNETKELQPLIFEAFKTSKTINEAFSKIDKGISIDYAILEKSSIISTVPVDIGWNDLGSFDAFYEIINSDSDGNRHNSDVISIDSTNNLIYTQNEKLIATIGVQNLILIDTKDALLICQKDESQKVKIIIEELTKRNDNRREYHVQDYRPWGQYTILEEQKKEFKIKRILVHPGKKLSYQYHHHRSEHWIVVRGLATVIIDGIAKDVPSGESVFIRPQQKHRLANNTNDIVEIIEVQLGEYLEEDDIIRLDDDFNRP